MINPLKIAVTGAGVAGLCTAYELSRDGYSITIYDPAPPCASLMAGGMLAPYSEIEHMPQSWITAGRAGIAFWESIGAETGYRRMGTLFIAHGEDRYMLERFRTHLPPAEGRLLNREEIAALEPALPAHFRNALYIPEEAHLEPEAAYAALLKILSLRNVSIIKAVAGPEDLQKTHDLVIDCRGMGAQEDDKDLRGVKGEILKLRNTEFALRRPVRLMHPRYPLYIVPRPDNVFVIGATLIESAEARHVGLRSAMELLSAAYSLHPSFGDAQILDIRAGIRPAYPDNLPRIGRRGNIITANGLFRHGWLLAPVMARCIADGLQGRENHFISLFERNSDEPDHKRHSQNIASAA